MEVPMKIDGSRIRSLREAKAWSQEHLANAAGLSSRTVQRVEAENMASSETRLAIAAALGVPAASLMPEAPVPEHPVIAAARSHHSARWGWIGWAAGSACAIAAIVSNYYNGYASSSETARALGVIGALMGITAGLMGVASNWLATRPRR
ncbi:MAG TPA: helix-turn-helix transcriptional regulator [Steroidobacteraceae bacterium]|nr:helix-turn-helix transcriptional regulator [Steroidobacteraceae bacterium]